MRFSRSWSLRAAPDVVRARSLDRAARTAGFAQEGCRDVEVSVESTGPAAVVRVTRLVPTGADGPGLAVVGRHLAVEQAERWYPVDADGGVTAELEVTFPGRPITVTARIVLRPTPTGCEQVLTGQATVRIPGLGRLIERRVVDGVVAGVDQQVRGPDSAVR